jgi:hypothetical protein
MANGKPWTKLEIDAFWRDLVFEGFAYVRNEDVEQARAAIQIPFTELNRGGPCTRFTLEIDS